MDRSETSMNHPNPLLQDLPLPLGDLRATKIRRLGTALHQLAVDLARERRRTAALERELAELRAEHSEGARDDHIRTMEVKS
jgi:hypothetical protein